ncbi:hypothetical protein I316_02077 [Kwoniella heveanensis BCC8398]|uniref:FAS1 domain-containing protein n=1 Tax=Kwoniella heveanensis BCC8398 TaxID=1296120 RepID=A0A1B9GYX4_9TREE|nr:hypothetical protein I316_02077 [Kwoniella heveanensis BCC8398]
MLPTLGLWLLPSFLPTFLLSTLPSVEALPSENAATYYDGLKNALSGQALTNFWHALEVVNDIEPGKTLVDKLYSDDEFTLYVPVNAAWEGSNLTQPTANDDLVSLLSYHIVQATLNSSTDIAPSRRHTIAFTELRSPTVDLPGDQTQVMVLQTAEDPTTGGSIQGEVLIRGDNWNASSVGQQFVYENLYIQPIDKILAIPSPLIKTLSQTGLALLANMGAASYVDFTAVLSLHDRLASCNGCTFFVPVNRAFEEAGGSANGMDVASLSSEDQTAIILNHQILNGTVEYSPSLSSTAPYITAAGTPLLYLTGDGGKSYISVGKYRAGIVRANIPVSNGVVHLIDTLMISTINNVDRAEEAAESASHQAEDRTTTANVIGVGGPTSSSPTTPTSTITTTTTPLTTISPSSSGSSSGGADSAGHREMDLGMGIGSAGAGVGVKMGLMVIAFGAMWL